MRLDVQGLRCIAVVFVLLYHLWDTTFTVGFLGVDIFFVISGYLMSMILTKRVPLTLDAVSEFYFRRIRRIVPLFLFVVFCILIAGIFLLAPVEFPNLSTDAFTSSVFMSNFLNLHNSGYFNLYSEFVFYKHTWSMAVEIQYYLLVPLLFYTFNLLDHYKKVLKFLLIGILITCSFVLQTTTYNADAAHLRFQHRIWQFMFGFLAFYTNSGQIPCPTLFQLQFDEIKDEEKSVFRKRVLMVLNELINLTLLALLLLFVSVDLTGIVPLNRVIVTTIVSIMLAKSTSNALLSVDFIVFVGDISYSIYLIHWPVFAFHRYWFAEIYLDRNTHPTFIIGVQLIFSTILIAYFVEKLYRWIGHFIKNWIYLLFTLLISYGLVTICILYVCHVSPKYSYDHQMEPSEQMEARAEILQLYNTRQNESIQYNRQEISTFNMEIHVFSAHFYTCENSTRRIPTHYEANLDILSWFCHAKGMGTKTIVIIGNSHGRELWHGLTANFQNVYKTLTLFVRDYCMPFMSKHAAKASRSTCEESERQLIPILRQWHQPIDIIIIGNEYFNDLNPKIVRPLENDEYFTSMQKFLNELEGIAQELVFFPKMHMDWIVEPYAQILQKRLFFQQDLKLFEMTIQQHKQYLSNVQKRIEMLQCGKCVQVTWSDVWCNENGSCKALDFRNLTYFRDSKHVDVYGSFEYGKMLFDLYDQYLASGNKTLQ